MIPIPTSRVFRSRGGALKWSFWVLVSAAMTAVFSDPPATGGKPAAPATAAVGMTIDDATLNDLAAVMNAS